MLGENQMFLIYVNISSAFLMTLRQIENDLSIWGKRWNIQGPVNSDMEAGGGSTLKGLRASKAASHTVPIVTHQHTGSTGSVAGSLEDSYTCSHPPGSDNHADICGSLHTRPCLLEIEETVCQSLVFTNQLHIVNRWGLGRFHTFTRLSIRIQCKAALAVAAEAPRTVLADAVGATQIGVTCTFIVVYADREEGTFARG